MCEISGTDTLYGGQLVKHNALAGAAPMGVASGASDTTGEGIPFGIVVGSNDEVQTHDTTFNTFSATGVDTQAAQVALATTRRGNKSTFGKGDPQRLVDVALVGPNTVIRSNIWSGTTSGAAMNVQTVTTGSADGASYTANATDVAGLDGLSTAYCRTGANAGLYRITDDTSTTAITVVNNRTFPYDIAIGDTFVRTNLRTVGLCRAQFDTESIWINSDAAVTADYYSIIVLKLDLSKPGEEFVEFKFTTDHFNTT
jgi:hypothetical protein